MLWSHDVAVSRLDGRHRVAKQFSDVMDRHASFEQVGRVGVAHLMRMRVQRNARLRTLAPHLLPRLDRRVFRLDRPVSAMR
jgi:hypothetical protein